MSNIQNLAAQATAVKIERQQGANTADRVGSLLEGIVSELGTTQDSITNIYNEFITNNTSNTKVTMGWYPASTGNLTTLGDLVVNDKRVSITAKINSSTTPSTGGITSVSWAQQTISGNTTYIGDLMVNGVSAGKVYAPSGSSVTPGGGGQEGGDGTTPSSDTQHQIDVMNQAIQTAEEQAAKEKARLDALLKKLDSQINDTVLNMDNQAAWIQENFDADKIFGYSGWNEALQGYMQRVGLWKTDESTTYTFWSDIQQTYNGIKTTVNAVSDAGGLSEYLSSHIDQWIQDGTVTIDLGAMYARKDAEKLIEWLYSGLTGKTNAEITEMDLYSAASNPLHKAISDIHSYVQALDDGTYIAGLDLSTKVDAAIASIWEKVTSGEVTTGALAELNGNLSTLVNTVTGDSSNATITTKVNRWKAGLVTTSNLDSAIVSMIATKDGVDPSTYPDAIAAITAKVKEGYSEIELTADVISNTAQKFAVKMEKLVMGNNNFYMHTIDQDGQCIGFELLCSNSLSVDKNGNYHYGDYASKIRLYYDYVAIDDLSSDHIIMSNGDQTAQGGGTSWIKMEKDTRFYWYQNVYASGMSYAFDNELGFIRFGEGGIYINGNLSVNGTITSNN